MFAYKEPDRVGKLACLGNLFHDTGCPAKHTATLRRKEYKAKIFQT